MTSQLFPRTAPDGTFSVQVCLNLSGSDQDNLGLRIQLWIDTKWMPNRTVWTREWSSGVNFSIHTKESLQYADSFLGAPIVASSDDSELRIKFIGRARKAPWRDWLVSRFMVDLKADFPEVGEPVSIRDSEPPDR
jgi:hypothetical protein